MTNDETVVIMGILKTAYPNYYRNMKKAEAEKTIALWTELLSEYPLEICAFAVKRLITESQYVPTISEIVSRIKELQKPEGNGAIDAWNILAKAAAGSIRTQEQYDTLPYEVKRFCGSLSGLRDLGMLDADIFNSVTRGQFMKVFDGMKRSKETLDLMPPELRELTQKSVKQIKPLRDLKQNAFKAPDIQEIPAMPIPYRPELVAYEPLSDEEWNRRRNEMTEKLKGTL